MTPCAPCPSRSQSLRSHLVPRRVRPQEAARDGGRDRGHLRLFREVLWPAAGDQVRRRGRAGRVGEGRGGGASGGSGSHDGSRVDRRVLEWVSSLRGRRHVSPVARLDVDKDVCAHQGLCAGFRLLRVAVRTCEDNLPRLEGYLSSQISNGPM